MIVGLTAAIPPAAKTETGDILEQVMMDGQLNEICMRRVQTTPRDFLRKKFYYQMQKAETKLGSPQ